MRPTNNIGYLLNHLAFVLSRQSDQTLQERLAIGFSQFKIMMVLQWDPHIRQRQIADRLGQTEASISRQIKLLHEEGLLSTQISPKNRREHITTLTAKGQRLTEKARNVLNDYHSPVFNSLSAKDQQKLIELLSRMHQKVCQRGRPGACNHPLGV